MLPINRIAASPTVHLLMVLIVLAATFAIVSSSPAASQTDGSGKPDQQATVAPSGKGKPVLFDFDNYQRLFNKRYGSRLEAAVRKCYFYAKAIKAYISGVAYKFRRSSSYLAINEFSDWTKQELDMMTNKILTRRSKSEMAHETRETDDMNQESDLTSAAGDSHPEQVANEFENKVEETFSKADYVELLEDERKLTNSDGSQPIEDNLKMERLRPRHMSMDKLVQGNELKIRQAEASDEIYHDAEYNFDDDKSQASEDKTTIDQLENQQKDIKSDAPRGLLSMLQMAKDALVPYVLETHDEKIKVDAQEDILPDEMFIDLRQSGCILPVKRQGKCGSCYAFVAMAIAEFFYCKTTGKLVEFSEQYLVDCSKDRVEKMNGCKGGYPESVPKFINKYGLELARTYAYVKQEQECPYSKELDINKTGFIRMKVNDYYGTVRVDKWPIVLKHSPIDVTLFPNADFSSYGGGVYDGMDCGTHGGAHAMVLVGHGREDGQEFWLLRNSYGARWGEKGYLKIAKLASNKCFEHNQGFVYGTKDGFNYDFKASLNKDNEVVAEWLQWFENQQKQWRFRLSNQEELLEGDELVEKVANWKGKIPVSHHGVAPPKSYLAMVADAYSSLF